MPFRPALVPTLASAGALLILVNLSAWQLRRHLASEDNRAHVHQNLDAEPAVEADLAQPAAALDWRRVVLRGAFDDGRVSLVLGRFEGGAPGFDLLVPFRTEGGVTLLVQRGWIPQAGWRAALESVDTHGAPQEIEGLALHIQGSEDLRPLPATADAPERWTMELDRVGGCAVGVAGSPYAAIAARVDPRPELVVVLGPERRRGEPSDGARLPISGYVAEPKQIGHLSYAAQWAMIAVTLVSLWTWAGFRRGRLLAGPTGPTGR